MKKLILFVGLFALLWSTGCSSKATLKVFSDGDLDVDYSVASDWIEETRKVGFEKYDFLALFSREDLTDGTKMYIAAIAYKNYDLDTLCDYIIGRMNNEIVAHIVLNNYMIDDYHQFVAYYLSGFDQKIVQDNITYDTYLEMKNEANELARQQAEIDFEAMLIQEDITREEYETYINGQGMGFGDYRAYRASLENEETITDITTEEGARQPIDPKSVVIEFGRYISENRQIVVYGNEDGFIEIALSKHYADVNLDLTNFKFVEAFQNADGSISVTKTAVMGEALTIYPHGTGFIVNDEIFYRVAFSPDYKSFGFYDIDYRNVNFIDNWYYDYSELYKGVFTYTYDYGDDSKTDIHEVYQVIGVEEYSNQNGESDALRLIVEFEGEIDEHIVYFNEYTLY